jgi:hypothetical protein
VRRWLARHRATLFLIGILLMGAVLGQAVSERTSGQREPSLTSTDANPTGALALAMWLESLGYRVNRLDRTSRSLDDVGVLFVLLPRRAFSRAEASAILDWVRSGGVLVYMPSRFLTAATGDPDQSDGLANQLDVASTFVPTTETASARQSVFVAPATEQFTVKAYWGLDLRSDEWIPAVVESNRVFAATRALGEGRVYAASSEQLFSNEGIGIGSNAVFVQNVLARARPAPGVAFEEAHHQSLEVPDLLSVMRGTPWGWAVFYGLIVSFLFMLWGGRRFGPPVLAAVTPARSSGEYISAFAGMLQRARATDWLQKRYAALVRRRLAVTFGVRADLPARDLARVVADRRPVDAEALAVHLTELDGPPVGERRLLDLVRDLEVMLRQGER